MLLTRGFCTDVIRRHNVKAAQSFFHFLHPGISNRAPLHTAAPNTGAGITLLRANPFIFLTGIAEAGQKPSFRSWGLKQAPHPRQAHVHQSIYLCCSREAFTSRTAPPGPKSTLCPRRYRCRKVASSLLQGGAPGSAGGARVASERPSRSGSRARDRPRASPPTAAEPCKRGVRSRVCA